jgi:hypothetical protein
MNHLRISLAGVLFLVASAMLPGIASAQATRTWVSGVGDDVNPCSRTAPCKTFAGAISKTAAGGIINCLDPAGYGTLTIVKSITIDCAETTAGMLSSGTNGVNINAAAGDIITLRGLNIEGDGTGNIGVNHIAGGVLHIEKCVIYGFRSGSAIGVLFSPAGAADLFISDSVIKDNGSSVGGGVVIEAVAGTLVTASLRNVKLNNNLVGLLANGDTANGPVRVHIGGSMIAGNYNAGVAATSALGATTVVFDGSQAIANTTGLGLYAQGGQAKILIGNSTIMHNNYGVGAASGGQLYTYGTNQIAANITSDGTPIANGLQKF